MLYSSGSLFGGPNPFVLRDFIMTAAAFTPHPWRVGCGASDFRDFRIGRRRRLFYLTSFDRELVYKKREFFLVFFLTKGDIYSFSYLEALPSKTLLLFFTTRKTTIYIYTLLFIPKSPLLAACEEAQNDFSQESPSRSTGWHPQPCPAGWVELSK